MEQGSKSVAASHMDFNSTFVCSLPFVSLLSRLSTLLYWLQPKTGVGLTVFGDLVIPQFSVSIWTRVHCFSGLQYYLSKFGRTIHLTGGGCRYCPTLITHFSYLYPHTLSSKWVEVISPSSSSSLSISSKTAVSVLKNLIFKPSGERETFNH